MGTRLFCYKRKKFPHTAKEALSGGGRMQEKTKNGKEQTKALHMGGVEIVAKYFLLTVALSFIGWAFEASLLFFTNGKFYNPGFMTLPFCPIYGCSLMLVYFLIGTPDEGRGVLKNVENPITRYSVYLAFSFLIPTAAELIVGFFFDVFFDVWLWSYNGMPFNFHGYIALPVSLAWTFLIFVFMKYFFPQIKRVVFKIPKNTAILFAVIFAVVITVDMTLSYISI